MVGPWANGGKSGEAGYSAVWREMFDFAAPSDLRMNGYDFQAAGQMEPAARKGFEAVVRLVASVLTHGTRFCTRSVSANELFSVFRQYLEAHGWTVANEAACEWLVEVRASRNTLIGQDAWRVTWDIHVEQALAALQARRVLAREHFARVQPHAVDERSESAAFANASCGQSVIHLSVYKHYGLFHIHAMCAFDDALEAAAQEFFTSRYLWTLYPKNYASQYGQRDGLPGTVVINRPIEGRDGDGMYLECFDAGRTMTSGAKRLNIPLATTQMHLKCEHRSL